MRIDILSVVPELLESPLNHSIIKRAREKKIVEIYGGRKQGVFTVCNL